MGRHGECAPVASLKRKVPDLGTIADPQSFAAHMRQNGYATTVTPHVLANGTAFKVAVPAKELALIFVTTNMCITSSLK